METAGLTYVFPDGNGIKNIAFQVKRGEIYALYGGHHAGKSVLLQTIIGTLRPQAGTLKLFGNIDYQKERRRIGFVPQKPVTIGSLSPADMLRYFSSVFGTTEIHILDILHLNLKEKKAVRRLPLSTQRLVNLAVTGYEQSQKSAEKFIALIDKYENFDTLTNTMLNEFVEKILVHERSRKGSQDTTQEIEIYFNFLGRYIPPSLQPVPLTPEEQEELRKREERKDRLHQNYLKRKASGAQKRYEDKIKAKKKAEMDAKKALIRAEDMKKGVFSTIGQLPKEEPRKGSIAASAAV